MNRRVLLAWELGGGRGHAHIAAWVARALKARGYEPVLAVQQLDSIRSVETELEGIAVFQAPLWPGVINTRSFVTTGENITLGDVLAEFGLRSPSAVRYTLRAWDELLALVQPAAIVADFAPGILLAARGRIPTVAVGEGFTLPPATMKRFPHLIQGAAQPKYDEHLLLDIVNTELRATSRTSIAHLPEVFRADRSCTAAFAEFDAYRAFREHPNAGPWMPHWDRSTPREGEELFGYFSISAPFQSVIVRSLVDLAKTGMPVRVHMPQVADEALALLVEQGVLVERTPLPFGEIQRRSRFVVSLGSLSFAACALVAGIPQIIFPLGVSKQISGDAIEAIGAGRSLLLNAENPLESTLLTQVLIEAHSDERLAARAKEVAPDFIRRLEPRPDETVARHVEDLIGRA